MLGIEAHWNKEVPCIQVLNYNNCDPMKINVMQSMGNNNIHFREYFLKLNLKFKTVFFQFFYFYTMKLFPTPSNCK